MRLRVVSMGERRKKGGEYYLHPQKKIKRKDVNAKKKWRKGKNQTKDEEKKKKSEMAQQIDSED